jgi:5-methylcytosine-specific restriction protein A
VFGAIKTAVLSALGYSSGPRRSPLWPSVRKAHLLQHPRCEVCGCTDNLEVHHVKPFQYFPELELVSSNLRTACETPARNCHLNVGHSGDFKGYNPHFDEDAALMLKRRKERKYSR